MHAVSFLYILLLSLSAKADVIYMLIHAVGLTLEFSPITVNRTNLGHPVPSQADESCKPYQAESRGLRNTGVRRVNLEPSGAAKRRAANRNYANGVLSRAKQETPSAVPIVSQAVHRTVAARASLHFCRNR